MAQVKKLKPRRRPAEAEAPPPMFHWWATWPFAWSLLILVGYFTYSNSNDGRLFFDDLSSIIGNPYNQVLANPDIRRNLHGLGDALENPKDSFEARRERGTLGYLDIFWSPLDNPLAGRPIVQFSFTLNHWFAVVMHPSQLQDFYGVMDLHHKYYHWVNLAIHIAVAMVLWSLARRVLQSPAFGERFEVTAPYWAAAVALIWLVHPLNTETVVYVTQRTELILAFFFLSTFYFAARSATAATDGARVSWNGAAVLACALGMASKENMIAAPLLLPLFDRAFFYPTWADAFRRRWPLYVGIFATYSILLFLMLQNPRGESVGFHHQRMLWYEYLITQCWCLWRYMWLSVLPLASKLCVDYGRRVVFDFTLTAPGALLVGAILAATVWGFVKKPWVAFLGCWYFFILAPTSSFVPIVTEVGAERRMYLPLMVVIAALCIGVVEGVKYLVRLVTLEERLPAWTSVAAGVGVVGVTLLFGSISFARNKDYLNDLRLYGHIVEVFPENDRGSNNFAKICVDHNDHEKALNLLNTAVYIDPEYSDAFTNRGIVYHHRQRYDVAIQNATEALRWNPKNISAWNNRGNAFMEIKEFERAVSDFTEVIRLSPFDSNGYFGRANVYFTMEAHAEALADCDEALKRNPNDFKVYNTKGNVLKKMGRPLDALSTFEAAIEMIRKEALSVKHPWWDAVERAMEFDLSKHVYAMSYPHQKTLAAIFGNRADAYRMLWESKTMPNAEQHMLNDLTRAIVFDPQNVEYFRVRGIINFQLQRFAEAKSDLSVALNNSRNFNPQVMAEMLRLRAKAAQQMRDFDTAWADVRRLQEMGRPPSDNELMELRTISGRPN